MSVLTAREYVGRVLGLLEVAVIQRPSDAGGSTDTAGLLSAMLDNQEQLFPNEFKRREARAYIHELKVTRNKWAHSEPLSIDDALRAADTVGRLLGLLGRPTGAVDLIKQELRLPAMSAAPVPASTELRSSLSTIAVVAWGKKKQSTAAAAANLYTGPIVRRSVDAARAPRLPIYVLSTKYGLVSGETIMEPYDLSLEDMSNTEYLAWQDTVRGATSQLCERGLRHVVAFASRPYRDAFVTAVKGLPVTLESHPAWGEICCEAFK